MVGLRVLVVDDKPDMRFVVTRLLGAQRPDWVVHQAGSVAEALDEMRDHAFDLVVADYRLPDGDGLALAPTVTNCPPPPGFSGPGRQPACILMTGFADEDLVRKVQESPAVQGLVTKPFEPDAFLEVLELALQATSDTKARAALDARLDDTGTILREQDHIEDLLAWEANHKRRIIVVDDEPDTVEVLCDVLQHEFDVEVVGAQSTRAARTLLAQSVETVLMIVDHLLPGESGSALVQEVQRKHPEVHCILMTGLFRLPEEPDADVEVVHKPLDPEWLLGEVGRVLTASAAAKRDGGVVICGA